MATVRIAVAVLVCAAGLKTQILWAQPQAAPVESIRTSSFVFPRSGYLPELAMNGWGKALAGEGMGIGLISVASSGKLILGPVSPSSLRKAGTLTFNPMGSAFLMAESQNTTTPKPPARPKAVTYSSGRLLRLKIHKYASLATLPLFISEYAVGQKLYNGSDSESLRSAHSALASSIGVLFAANTVTGLWDLWETRKNFSGHKKQMFHGILMLAADVGFLATGALAPSDEEEEGISTRGTEGNRALHRKVAVGSMGIAAVSYLYMLLVR
jgi:hypothetical protein